MLALYDITASKVYIHTSVIKNINRNTCTFFSICDYDEHSKLTINLNDIANNYKELSKRSKECGVVVKSDAYGLGIEKISQALFDSGCRIFFVSRINEGTKLRKYVKDSKIFILDGPYIKNYIDIIKIYNLTPVFNTTFDLMNFINSTNMEYAIHVDTGMHRLAIPYKEAFELSDILRNSNTFAAPSYVLSHLSTSEDKNNQSNKIQLEKFQKLLSVFPYSKFSFSNSGGIFLGDDYIFDLTRPGVSLYGIFSNNSPDNNIKFVLNVETFVLQIQEVGEGDQIGYGGEFTANQRMKIATIGMGYSDGMPRNRNTKITIDGEIMNIVGRVSMGLTTIDVTNLKKEINAGDKISIVSDYESFNIISKSSEISDYELLIKFSKNICKRWTY